MSRFTTSLSEVEPAQKEVMDAEGAMGKKLDEDAKLPKFCGNSIISTLESAVYEIDKRRLCEP